MTASDYCHIMKIAIFALDEIFSEENEITCKELCELYTKFNKMYTMSRQESYTENELNIFERKELTPTTSSMKFIRRKTEGFGKILWELNLDSINEKIKSLKKSENLPHPNYIEGLAQIITALDTFLDTSSQDSENDFFIKIYDSVHLESEEILKSTGEF
ncbi:hypothetical protein GLOIN_2v1770410 [Rhizophagus irregularis DAOM 181602=DAOM 197198]|nr:hypothetical protein GLOIN_2v1770410 [Rhizophagus irregularis DAOM 181602=DAOM 197198]